MSWIFENKEWLFSGAGLTIIGFFYALSKGKSEPQPALSQNITINNQNNSTTPNDAVVSSGDPATHKKSLDEYKGTTRILFIDDDTQFKVAKILSKSGWVHTKLVKDVRSLDDRDIIEASILFIDVQGVGHLLGFSDEGLGLASALKDKYPEKRVVIYSAETQGDRFHKALRKADSSLPKNADPYEFQRLVEEFTIGEEH